MMGRAVARPSRASGRAPGAWFTVLESEVRLW